MSFADERFLPTGTYAIINAAYKNSITFSEGDQCLSTSSAGDYQWTISCLKNKRWTIQGPSDIFLDIGPYAEEGDDVVSTNNPSKPHQWVIKRHPEAAQAYMIYSPSQSRLFWSLPTADLGITPQFSADYTSASSLWVFKKIEDPATGADMPEPMQVHRPTRLINPEIKNRFAVTIPPGWLATITSVSCGSRSNLVRIRRIVNGALETQELVSGWDATSKAMTLDGSDSDCLALPSEEASYVLVIEAFHSRDPERKDASRLPESKDLSTDLRVFTSSRPNDMKSFPDFQTFTIFNESPDLSGLGATQNAVITIHTSVNFAVENKGYNETQELGSGWDATSKVMTSDGSDSGSGPRLLYYRVYTADGAVATKRPAYSDDAYIGCIMSKWVAPPHHAASLRLCLSTMENIDPSKTHLFSGPSSKTALTDDTPISLNSSQALGLIPEEPLVLLCEVIPENGLKAGTESLRIPPDGQSPLAPRFLYYGVYTQNGVFPSTKPVDAQEAWVSRIELNLLPPPLSVASLKRSIAVNEGIAERNISSSQLFVDKDTLTPLSDDHVVTEDSNWPGSTADDHVLFKFETYIMMTIDGSTYGIRNCSTGRLAQLYTHTNVGTLPDFHLVGISVNQHPTYQFTFKSQGNGDIAIQCLHLRQWVGPNLTASATEQGYSFIRSNTDKDCFFICLHARQALYDGDLRKSGALYEMTWKEFDAKDQRQMWRLDPV